MPDFVAGLFHGFFWGVITSVGSCVFTASAPEQVRDRVRQQAIQAGAGHWSIDPKTGERTFEWGCAE